MRRKIIAGNWKMNNTVGEAADLVNSLKRAVAGIRELDIVVIPPFTALSDISDMLSGSNIDLGAQNVYWEESGAFTGEISPGMLKELGVKYVLVGHSERRTYFGESNESVNRKVKAVLLKDMLPIMCIGERLEERESAKTFEVIEDHLTGGLKDISKEDALKITIAYEPVWAIGTGKTATPDQAEEAHLHIRKVLARIYDEGAAKMLRIQYGGSVKPDNIGELISCRDIDGALVGGASLDADKFAAIVSESARKGD